MATKRLLRVLILAQIPLLVAVAVATFLSFSTLPEPLRSFNLSKEDTPGVMPLSIGLLVALVLTSIGLFLLWNPARILYVITSVALLLVTPLLGPSVSSGWTEMFELAVSVNNGMILAIIYCSPLKELFEKRAAPKAAVLAEETVVAIPAAPVARAATPVCPACGARVQDTRFCPECGYTLRR